MTHKWYLKGKLEYEIMLNFRCRAMSLTLQVTTRCFWWLFHFSWFSLPKKGGIIHHLTHLDFINMEITLFLQYMLLCIGRHITMCTLLLIYLYIFLSEPLSLYHGNSPSIGLRYTCDFRSF